MRLKMALLLEIFLGLIWIGIPARAQVFFNNQMSYQGYLKNGASPLNDLTGFPMMFVIRKNNTAIWCQTTSAGGDIPVVNGIFTALLSGASNCLSLSRGFDQTLFVASSNADVFTIDTTVDVQKNGFGSPDDATFAGVLLLPVPLALVANQANTAVNISGVFAGDITGTQSASVVSKIQGVTVAASAPANGQVLAFGGGGWVPTTLPTPPVTSVAGRTGVITLTTADIGGLGTAATLNLGAVLQTANNLSELSATASTARSNLSAAQKGANGDITSLSGLTTALPLTEGGTGATSASTARTSLGAAASGANSDITSLTAVTSVVSSGNLTASSAAGSTSTFGSSSGSSATTVNAGSGTLTLTGAGTSASAVTISSTGSGGGITMSPGTGGLTINSSTTQKVKIGSAGSTFSAMGACTFTAAMSTTEATATCTGVPASTSVVVHCSPTAAPSAAVGTYFRAKGTLNSIAIAATGSISSATWSCIWWQP